MQTFPKGWIGEREIYVYGNLCGALGAALDL